MVALHSGQQVYATDGSTGRVDLLLLDHHDQVSSFVIRKGGIFGRDVIVPVDRIRKIDERGVYLAMEKAALDQLPPYRPDSMIREDVDHALWMDEVIRASDLDSMDAVVRDGVVWLRGYASTPGNKRRAEQAASQVEGVLQVEDQIVTEVEVVAAVAEALGHDARTRGQQIFANADHGVVALNGELESAQARAIAEKVVAGVPQVRGIINLIRAPGVVIDSVEQWVLQPKVGQDVYTEDSFLGALKWVILSLRNRRVANLVVHVNLSELDMAEASAQSEPFSTKERDIVCPIEVVQHVTPGEVRLTLNATEALKCPDFKPDDYVAPNPGWQPPYPYKNEDILLDQGRTAAARSDYRPAFGDVALAAAPAPDGHLVWQRIWRRMPVLSRDGRVGEVDHILLDPEHGSVGMVVVLAGDPLPADIVIPLDWAMQIDESGIMVDAGKNQIASLPVPQISFSLLPTQGTRPSDR